MQYGRVLKIASEIGDGADRRRKRIRTVERYIKRSGVDGLSNDQIVYIADYDLGLTRKKVEGIIKLLKKMKKIHMNEKRRWISI